jgi:hypothetical protein
MEHNKVHLNDSTAHGYSNPGGRCARYPLAPADKAAPCSVSIVSLALAIAPTTSAGG